jgi:membrane protease subunit HflK
MPWNDNSKPGPWGAPPSGDKPNPGADDNSRPSGDSGSQGSGSGGSAPKGPKNPWGSLPSGGRGPSGPGGGRPRPPRGPGSGPGPVRNAEIEALIQKARQRAERFFRNPNGDGVRPGALAAVAGAAVGLWLLSGVYIVQPDEEAVITRFGAYVRSEGPGLKIRLPSPIERIEKVSVTTLNRINIGGTTGPLLEQSLMLTGTRTSCR